VSRGERRGQSTGDPRPVCRPLSGSR
jgi:hypothetical protein